MKQLAALQHTFQKRILDPSAVESSAWVSARGRASPETQLLIYTYAYRARLQEVLANDYPALRVAMGDDNFYHLADAYIQAHPSHYFSLRDFGCHLSVFVTDWMRRQELHMEIPWSHELVLFEWTLGQAFDAANGTIFTERDMAVIPVEDWPGLRFRIHPSVHTLDLEWNIPEMWRALTDEPPAEVIARREAASPWLVWREKLITRFRSLEADEQDALGRIREGGNFNDVCGVLATRMREAEVPMRAAGLLKGWITQGLISGVEY